MLYQLGEHDLLIQWAFWQLWKFKIEVENLLHLHIEVTEIVQGGGVSICERDFEAYLKTNFRRKAKKGGHWWGRYKSVSQSVLPLTFCEQILTIQTQLLLYHEKSVGGGGFLW